MESLNSFPSKTWFYSQYCHLSYSVLCK